MKFGVINILKPIKNAIANTKKMICKKYSLSLKYSELFRSIFLYAVFIKLYLCFGGLAHLVERKHGMFEVVGSSPTFSTKILDFF
jgi:hypothetical protein